MLVTTYHKTTKQLRHMSKSRSTGDRVNKKLLQTVTYFILEYFSNSYTVRHKSNISEG